ncbi:FAD:protein FMN transferase [Massilia sp. TN1-12]|uniref:FAD:protein FMN transferase n=1 Tax=Massilia paldalensis TaxID=3377675 RepID=UPI00384DBDCB
MERAVLIPAAIDPVLPPSGSRPHTLAGTSMGTGWSARFMVPPSAPPGLEGGLRRLLQAELDLVVAQMSHWEPDSLLSRFNAAPAGSWIDLPDAFYDVIDYALRVRDDTHGAYDPAAGALVNLWGFGPVRRYDQAGFYAPAADAVAAVMAQRGAARVELDRERRRLLQPGGALLDLSSVAKGYAVDRLTLCLDRHGLRHHVVEAGGELRGAGVKEDGQPWWVEVEGVPDADTPQAVVALHGLAIATSGDYRRYFEPVQGRRASHTLDPRTGWPIAHDTASVTVLAPTCMAADALSTALTVLGPEDGLAFAEERAIAARFLVRRSAGLVESSSSAWRQLLE